MGGCSPRSAPAVLRECGAYGEQGQAGVTNASDKATDGTPVIPPCAQPAIGQVMNAILDRGCVLAAGGFQNTLIIVRRASVYSIAPRFARRGASGGSTLQRKSVNTD